MACIFAFILFVGVIALVTSPGFWYMGLACFSGFTTIWWLETGEAILPQGWMTAMAIVFTIVVILNPIRAAIKPYRWYDDTDRFHPASRIFRATLGVAVPVAFLLTIGLSNPWLMAIHYGLLAVAFGQIATTSGTFEWSWIGLEMLEGM